MVLQSIAAVLIVIVSSLFVRLWPRRNRPFLGTDTWGFLFEARAIRENGFRVPDKIEARIMDEPYDYPPAFSYFLSLLPSTNLASRSKFISPLFDSIHAVIALVFVFLLSGDLLAGFISGMLFAISPVSVYESFTLTVRPFTSLIFTLFSLSLLSYAIYFNMVGLVFAVGFLVLIMLTHKFTFQVSLLFLAGLLIFFRDPIYLAVILSSLVIAIIISGGRYLKIARAHFAILAFWCRNINRRRKLGQLSWIISSLSKIGVNPWIFFALLFAFSTVLSGAYLFLGLWLLIGLIGFMATAFKPLGFLGENNRYLEYGSFPVFALAGVYLSHNINVYSIVLASLFVLFGFLLLRNVWGRIISSKNAEIGLPLMQCIKFLKTRDETRLLCLPDVSSELLWFTEKRVLVSGSPTSWKKYPFFVFREYDEATLRRLIEDFAIELVVAFRSDSEALFAKSRFSKVFENDAYKVYVVKK